MMLGPMKKKMITVGVVSFIIPCLIFGVIFAMYSSSKNEQIAELDEKVAEDIRLGFSGDLPINHIIRSEDLMELQVKDISIPGNSYTTARKEEVIGQKLKLPVYSKTMVVDTMFYDLDDDVNNDVRVRELNMLALPSDLEQGDYIDIRVLFPTGEDFLVAVAKEVIQLGQSAESNSIFIELTEEEQEKLNGAIIESYIYDSIKVYAVKYANEKEQLFKEAEMDYVERYENTIEALISGDYQIAYAEAIAGLSPLTNESGEIRYNESGEAMYPEVEVEMKTADDYTIEEIALAAGMKVEDVEAIKGALEKEPQDEALLNHYRLQTIYISKLLEPNYPVRKEVAAVIKNNPNIMEEIKAKYNVEELEQQRANLVNTSIFKYDESTGLYEEDTSALGNITSNLDEEIELQKEERKQYLQNLIRNNMLR
ncbi:MAG: hypothetical protein IJX99_04600 [Clostridia bacterium]|nr:hypothetical protein [Clostridia bacterium]